MSPELGVLDCQFVELVPSCHSLFTSAPPASCSPCAATDELEPDCNSNRSQRAAAEEHNYFLASPTDPAEACVVCSSQISIINIECQPLSRFCKPDGANSNEPERRPMVRVKVCGPLASSTILRANSPTSSISSRPRASRARRRPHKSPSSHFCISELEWAKSTSVPVRI